MRARTVTALATMMFAGQIASADVAYRVTPDLPNKKLKVEMRFIVKGASETVEMPTWAPGSYVLSDFWKGVESLAASSESGPVTVASLGKGTWSVSPTKPGLVTLTYTVPAAGNRFATGEVNTTVMHFSGPSTYMYLADRKLEKCTVDFDLLPGWDVALGLNEVPNKGSRRFVAPDYDTLADNPVTMGQYKTLTYKSKGKPITIAMRGDASKFVDEARIIEICKFISDTEGDFFGGLPFDKYVWHFSVADRSDGGGGLEHLSSTQISLPSGLGFRAQHVQAHEFFHLWNVKRIRSRVLGPFDYTKLPKTGALWWLEGVTDYYASIDLHRYGWWPTQRFYRDIVGNVTGVRAKPARLQISPYDASFRVGEASNGRGNSDGLMVSYYNTGWLLGMLLDIELRSRTGGKASLDDVELALFNLCKNDQPGFYEDEIRRQLIRFGGAGMGDVYDKWVMSPGELPVEEQLAKMGLEMVEIERSRPTAGITGSVSGASGGIVVQTSTNPALKAKDVIVAFNDSVATAMPLWKFNEAWTNLQKASKEGDSVRLKVKHEDGTTSDVSILIGLSKAAKGFEILEKRDATAQQRSLRQGWFFGKVGAPKKVLNTYE